MLRLPTRKTRALLAYLAVHPGQSQARDKLATLLWGESGHTQARTSLRQSLAALRKSLGAAATTALHVDPKTISLDPAVVEADVDRFERLVAEASPAALEEAVALYRGELLEGFEEGAAPFEDWLLTERERLRERALEALARLLRHQADTGDLEAAIRTAQKLVAVDPLQEAAHRTLMRLYLGQGRRANALRQYQTCVGVLQRELGVEPEPETRDAVPDGPAAPGEAGPRARAFGATGVRPRARARRMAWPGATVGRPRGRAVPAPAPARLRRPPPRLRGGGGERGRRGQDASPGRAGGPRAARWSDAATIASRSSRSVRGSRRFASAWRASLRCRNASARRGAPSWRGCSRSWPTRPPARAPVQPTATSACSRRLDARSRYWPPRGRCWS